MGSFEIPFFSTLGLPSAYERAVVFLTFSSNKYQAQIYAYYWGEPQEAPGGHVWPALPTVDPNLTEYTWFPVFTRGSCSARTPDEPEGLISNAEMPKISNIAFAAAVNALINKSGVTRVGAYSNYNMDMVFYSEVRFLLSDAVGYVADCANIERGAE